MQHDIEQVLAAIEQADGSVLTDLFSSPEIVSELVKTEAKAIALASVDVRSNENVVRNAVETWPYAIDFAPRQLRQDILAERPRPPSVLEHLRLLQSEVGVKRDEGDRWAKRDEGMKVGSLYPGAEGIWTRPRGENGWVRLRNKDEDRTGSPAATPSVHQERHLRIDDGHEDDQPGRPGSSLD